MMRLKAFLAVMLVFGALYIASGNSFAGSADGAFLNEPASNISQIVTQIEDSRLVALRYAKHFGTEPTSVLNYMRMELDVRTLDKETPVDVYYINNTLSIVKKSVILHAGTKVFANNAGLPILEYGSGNPLTDQLSTEGGLKSLANPQSGMPQGLNNTAPGTLGQSPSVTQPSATSEAGRHEKPSVAGIMPADQSTTVTALPIPSGVVTATSSAASPGGSISGWLIPLGVVGGAVAMLGGRGGPAHLPDTRQPVPEPAGLMVLGSGVIAITGYTVHRRRV